MIFRFHNKEYQGLTAVEVVQQISSEEIGFNAEKGDSVREFITWSLKKLSYILPPRELDLSPRVSDEVQARHYLSLRHDFGIGELID